MEVNAIQVNTCIIIAILPYYSMADMMNYKHNISIGKYSPTEIVFCNTQRTYIMIYMSYIHTFVLMQIESLSNKVVIN